MASQLARKVSTSSPEELFKGGDLQAREVRLRVVKGVAYLDGSVASYQQKKAMGAAVASLPSVRRVVNRLRVTPFSARSDNEVTQNVVTALQKDPILSIYSLAVAVNDGVVELRGQVPSLSGKIAAEALAWSVCGVRHVVNRIEVALETALDTSELGLAIKRGLQSYLGLPATAFDVRINKDTAILTGSVASHDQRWAAEDLVRYYPLVRQVDNRLQVRKPGHPPTPLSHLSPAA
jgi:osmotically-inducible protein OsmY